MCVSAAVSYLITCWDDMRITIQVALICWLVLLLAITVRPQVLTPVENVESHMRIERELADHSARLSGVDGTLRELKELKVPERLATIESTQQVNQYLLISILLSLIVLLLKDVRTWFGKTKGES